MKKPSPCIERLRDYIAIPSVNPMRRTDLPEDQVGERRLAEYLHEDFRRLGLDAVVIGKGERRSVVAEATSRGATETILIASHIDTVPVDGMEIDPFDPRIEDERVLGRGSCDTKAGMASCVAALETVLRNGTLGCNVVLVGEADEECGSVGVRDVLDHLGTRKPDWVLATEPTEMHVVTNHKGIALTRIAAHGRAHHSSAPEHGRNAITALSRAAIELEKLHQQLAEKQHEHLGAGTLSVNQFEGGHSPNIIPDRATLTLDRRLLPGESEADIRREIEGALRRAGDHEFEILSCSIEKPPLDTPENHPAALRCRSALKDIGLSTQSAVAAFGTDAGLFAEHDLPGIVVGPGSIREAHTSREFVEIRQVENATAFFQALFEASVPRA